MNASLNPLASFPHRYATESFPDGDGVLVDLLTGSYFRLNPTAVVICEALRLTGTIDDAVDHVAKQMTIPAAEAKGLITLVNDGLSRGTSPDVPTGPLTYQSLADGSSLFLEEGRTIFSVDGARRSVRLVASLSDLKVPLYLYLRSLMPKLLNLLDVPALHAAACWVGDAFLAFSGKSDAGKTTTARAFARAGAELISEDLLVLSLSGESPAIFTGGESFAREWARDTAALLEKKPAEEITFMKLAEARQGPTAPLEAMWLIEATRRTGADFGLRPLSISDGVLALLGNGFLATSSPHHWRAFLRQSRLIAERASLIEATMPDGVDQLGEAARRYIVNSAS